MQHFVLNITIIIITTNKNIEKNYLKMDLLMDLKYLMQFHC